ncbi:hypothetical protein NDU88_006448 [Pleurodeles waltl]|uniref:Uncharacterized protein n=1 Tax=Pleurodeles waltl TaxID=8319 RepID=A0AAV7MZ86_PLEWA|nr:hypothetical protein NDU88_006448 [Pleurodeles waltl]
MPSRAEQGSQGRPLWRGRSLQGRIWWPWSSGKPQAHNRLSSKQASGAQNHPKGRGFRNTAPSGSNVRRELLSILQRLCISPRLNVNRKQPSSTPAFLDRKYKL